MTVENSISGFKLRNFFSLVAKVFLFLLVVVALITGAVLVRNRATPTGNDVEKSEVILTSLRAGAKASKPKKAGITYSRLEMATLQLAQRGFIPSTGWYSFKGSRNIRGLMKSKNIIAVLGPRPLYVYSDTGSRIHHRHKKNVVRHPVGNVHRASHNKTRNVAKYSHERNTKPALDRNPTKNRVSRVVKVSFSEYVTRKPSKKWSTVKVELPTVTRSSFKKEPLEPIAAKPVVVNEQAEVQVVRTRSTVKAELRDVPKVTTPVIVDQISHSNDIVESSTNDIVEEKETVEVKTSTNDIVESDESPKTESSSNDIVE